MRINAKGRNRKEQVSKTSEEGKNEWVRRAKKKKDQGKEAETSYPNPGN